MYLHGIWRTNMYFLSLFKGLDVFRSKGAHCVRLCTTINCSRYADQGKIGNCYSTFSFPKVITKTWSGCCVLNFESVEKYILCCDRFKWASNTSFTWHYCLKIIFNYCCTKWNSSLFLNFWIKIYLNSSLSLSHVQIYRQSTAIAKLTRLLDQLITPQLHVGTLMT